MADDKTHHPIDGLAALVADMATDIRRRAVEEPWFGKPLDGPDSKLAGWGPADDGLGKFGPLPQSEWDPDALSPFAIHCYPNYWSIELNIDGTPRIEHDDLLRIGHGPLAVGHDDPLRITHGPLGIGHDNPPRIGHDPLLRLEGPKDEPPEPGRGVSP